MISYIEGSVKSVRDGFVILLTDGVGYGLRVSQDDADHLRDGQRAELFVYEHIQERAHDLYGFQERSAQTLFELLLDVNGVGPKAALAILDLGPVANVKQAIASGNTTYISGASGVGKKTAERVLVDLRDKLGEDVLYEQAAGLGGVEVDEALEALVSLGYSSQVAREALQKIEGETSEERIKEALKVIS